jgi:hypothetical protein
MTRKLFGAIRRRREINQATLRSGAIPVPSGFSLLNQAFVYSSRLFPHQLWKITYAFAEDAEEEKGMAHLLIPFAVT